MTLPILYKRTKTGATQTYQVSVDNNATITVTQGQLNGKLTSYITDITEGKNIGKANETTPQQQAEFEAASKHAKKLKSGYTLSVEEELPVKLPQKVKNFKDLLKSEKRLSALHFPCSVEAKLNGVNVIFRLENNVLSMYSRGGDEYPLPEHQIAPITNVMQKFNLTALSCEQYIHGEHLQNITSLVKKPKPGSEKLVAMIFDFPDSQSTYLAKTATKLLIASYIHNPTNNGKFIGTGIVISQQVANLDDLYAYNDEILKLGYEGIIVTNNDSIYQYNVRSSNAWKLKPVQDAEFEIVAYDKDKNGHLVLTCITQSEKTFKVKPRGTDEERNALVSIADSLPGQWLKVEYEVLSADGIPLKPVGILVRDCDSHGNPTT